MKKIYLTIIAIVAITQFTYAQWTLNGTNVYNTNTAGNVAVGTTNMPAKFNVYQGVSLGSAPQNYSLLSTISGVTGTNDFQNSIWLVRNAAGNDWYSTRLHDGISIDASFQTPQVNTQTWWERDPSQNIQSWGNGNLTYLSIHNGNVGIGTTDNASWQLGTSAYKLAVNGSIIATAITVKPTSSWPDYVFKKDYTLPLLTDLKSYIDLNHHLPEIPSEKEIATNGLDLGDIDRLLTKKVEELTLYLIEKDKQLNDEKEIINVQQNQIDVQKQQLNLVNVQMKAQDERLKMIELELAKLSK